MGDLLRKIEGYAGTPYTRIAMKLLAYLFVRTSELIEAKWEEFDLGAALWRIPASRMKKGTEHLVPLAPQAVEILRSLYEIRGQSGWLFHNERDHSKAMSNGAILGALRRMGYAGRMTGHGFRSVASTALHEMGLSHAHIETQLAHLSGDEVSRAYNAAQYLDERRAMMNAWADHLDGLRRGGQIVPIRAA
jgi:integrase